MPPQDQHDHMIKNLYHTRGIVLHHLKYRETSIITKIYTEKFGLQSYIVRGVRSTKAKTKFNLFQPANILDLVVYYKEKSSLKNIKEVKIAHHYNSIPFDVIKSSITLFIIEIFFKSIIEEEANRNLFDYLFHTLLALDETEKNVSDVPLLFMIRLTKYLGFWPQSNYSGTNQYFDLKEGIFLANSPGHDHYLTQKTSKLFYHLINNSSDRKNPFTFHNSDRKILLEKLIEYYKIHLPGIRDIKSHGVLSEVLAT